MQWKGQYCPRPVTPISDFCRTALSGDFSRNFLQMRAIWKRINPGDPYEKQTTSFCSIGRTVRTLADAVHGCAHSTLMSPYNMYYRNEHVFYLNGQLKAIWKYVDFIVSTKIFHFQQLPKMAPMYRQTQKSLFFSKCNFEPLIIQNIIFPIIFLRNVDFSEKWIF